MPAYIKVQRGEVSFTPNTATVDVTISTPIVDISHAFVILSIKGNAKSGAQPISQILAQPEFIDNSTLRFTRAVSSTLGADLSWQIVEADISAPIPAFLVERVNVEFDSGATSKTVALSSITDFNKCMVLIYTKSTSNNAADARVRGYLTSNTELQLETSDSTSGVCAEVVQWSSDFTVINGETDISAAATNVSANIGKTVDLSRSALFMTYDADTDGLTRTSVRGIISTATVLKFNKQARGGTNTINWTVVEFPKGVVSQRKYGTLSSTVYSTTTAISPVNLENTVVWSTNTCSSTSTTNPRQFIRTYFTNNTTIVSDVSYTGVTRTFSLFAVDFSNWVFTPAITSGGDIKVWSGSNWDSRPAKVWNGTSWVLKSVKFWNGFNWVTTS